MKDAGRSLLAVYALAVVACGPLGAVSQPIPDALLMHKHELTGHARCTDGTAAVFYYRNCTANADSKPGDPDFCAKGSPLGVSSVQWLVVFGGNDTLACFDDSSCAERASARPGAVSSAGAPATMFPDGVLSSSPEANPNFYKAHIVYVPYCSSDMWLGNASSSPSPSSSSSSSSSTTTTSAGSWQWRGRAIIRAVMENLAAGTLPNGDTIAQADQVLLAGGAGVLAAASEELLEALEKGPAKMNHSMMRKPATPALSQACDGCMMLNRSSFRALTPGPVANKTLSPDVFSAVETLTKGWLPWRASPPPGCVDEPPQACLLAPSLLARARSGWKAAGGPGDAADAPPLIVQQQQYDAIMLAQNGAWPITAENKAFAEQYAEAIRKTLVDHAGNSQPVATAAGGRSIAVFSAALSDPSVAFTSRKLFFQTPVRCASTNQTANLATVFGVFFQTGGSFPNLQCIDAGPAT